MANPQNTIIAEATAAYLDRLDPASPPPAEQVEKELLDRTNGEFTIENVGREPKHRIRLLQTLTSYQVAQIVVRLHGVVRLYSQSVEAHDEPTPDDNDPLLVWEPQRGVYVRSDDAIGRVSALYNGGGDERFHKETLSTLRRIAPYVRLEQSGRWAAVANGDLDRETLELHPFDPSRVFVSRLPVEWDPDAPSPVIHNEDDGTDWDFDSWLAEVASGDQGKLRLLRELIAATVNPQIRTNKAVGLYNPIGNNGKGTFNKLLTELVGRSNTVVASISSLSKESTLPMIAGASLIVSDENATNDFVKNAEIIKQLATRDPILVNPKYKQPYNTVFVGTQVHNLNSLPEFGDKSDSMWRRWLFIPLTARFEGKERKYIKDDYMTRPDVLRYVLRCAMQMGFTGTFTETDETRDLLHRAKAQNDPVRQFWAELSGRFTWDLVPVKFAYEVYKGWSAEMRPEGRVLAFTDFNERLRNAVADTPHGWVAEPADKQVRAGSRMTSSEPLVGQYQIKNWAPSVPATQRFRDVIRRDHVGTALGPAGAGPGSSPDAAARLAAVEALVAENTAMWERRAVEDHGVTDPSHVRAHARIISAGSSCACPSGSSTGAIQRRYPQADYDRVVELDFALLEARQAVEEGGTP